MAEIATLPRTPKERAQKATFVRATIDMNNLSYVWLIHELKREGFTISNTTVSSVLAGLLVSPKGDEFLMRAEMICRKYRHIWNTNQQSEI